MRADSDGYYLVNFAAALDRLEIAKLLQSKSYSQLQEEDADPNPPEKQSAFLHAVKNADLEMVKLFTETEEENYFWGPNEAVEVAIKKENQELLKYLMEKSGKDNWDRYP